MTDLRIRPMTPDDWPAVEAIFCDGIATGDATFEESPPTWEGFDREKVAEPRLVATLDRAVVGWAAATPVSDRCVAKGVIDHSVYVAADARGRGVGRVLLDALVEAAERAGYWTIQSGIFPENEASLRLHRAAGFRIVGTRERVGRMTYGPRAGAWRDLVLVERRSALVGID